MAEKGLGLMAHLLRRAGFGATLHELEEYHAKGYEATVEYLLHPEDTLDWDDDRFRRYQPDLNSVMYFESAQSYWMYKMINSKRPLEEKITLFWHGLFATAYGKLNHAKGVVNQTDTFRRHGLSSFHNILMELSRDPAMIFWLDNKDNHKDAPNENYGRELLELFSMGIGNYSEDDVKNCARAFTGWTIANDEYMSVRASRDSIWPSGRIDWQFEYRPEDHDDTEKNFLGRTGNFNGEDIIDIIAMRPATSWFIAGKLYNYFVSDTPNQEATAFLAEEYRKSSGDIRSMLRALFMSDYFKTEDVWYDKVKSPAELVVGTARLAGSFTTPQWDITNLANDANFMGQEILNPPTVEGWHTGTEWVDTGTLVERVNSSALVIGDTVQPGVQAMIQRLKDNQKSYQPDQLVDECLLLVGSLEVSEGTRQRLVEFAANWGEVKFTPEDAVACSEQQVVELLQLILATREYQMA
ncbi:MAG: DUF1800 domain-containing protein [SAR202 cluster bacterium]|jgi:uncharacterized protein (DUF1800 family)|nr:DUF1800 domain-containing protein [Dehalococcoidia bacterium]MQF87982.1 DUF1800 domain-containing protein [SAR202 cluster bacterium]|tara:strand:- start:826 stop:2229 length:1404 start_codon:yes stop_codon:yes gene_type:complete